MTHEGIGEMKAPYFVGGTIFLGAILALTGTGVLSAYFLLLLFVVLPALVIACIIRYRRQSNGIEAAVEKLKSEKGPFALEVPSRPALLVNEKNGTIFVVGPLKEDSDAVEILELSFGGIVQIEAKRIDAARIDQLNIPAHKEKWLLWLTTNKVEHPIVRLNIGDNESEALDLRNKISAFLTR